MSTHPLLMATTEGPLGFPLTDRQAIALDAILKALPKDDAFRYRKTILAKGASEVLSGERSDVSWISTKDPDRTFDVVLAKGMNDGQFKQNPIVTMQHDYDLPPVGKSLWRKAASDGPTRGIKAKTVCPARPTDWPQEKDWPADIAFALVHADLLRGKSIGFLPTRVHRPTKEEKSLNNWHDVEQVIDEWLLLEYSVTFLPAKSIKNASRSWVSGKIIGQSGGLAARGRRFPDALCAILGAGTPHRWAEPDRQGTEWTERQGPATGTPVLRSSVGIADQAGCPPGAPLRLLRGDRLSPDGAIACRAALRGLSSAS
jgi:hypothetical protein